MTMWPTPDGKAWVNPRYVICLELEEPHSVQEKRWAYAPESLAWSTSFRVKATMAAQNGLHHRTFSVWQGPSLDGHLPGDETYQPGDSAELIEEERHVAQRALGRLAELVDLANQGESE
jgi:hypothetical protein